MALLSPLVYRSSILLYRVGKKLIFPPQPARRQFGIFHRVLDVLLPETGLQGSGVLAGVGSAQVVLDGMVQHILEAEPHSSAGATL